MPEGTIERMRGRLVALAPLEIAIEDDSARHAGHPGAASGGGHYNLRMTSSRFEGKSRVERHRLVYDALADLMQREIHALAMVLLAPGETERRAGAPHPHHIPGH
jgi:BolA family transcriptional regulator, general stress-responsive regulator